VNQSRKKWPSNCACDQAEREDDHVILRSSFVFLFEFQNRIFLEFFIPFSSCWNIKTFEVRGSTVLIYLFIFYFLIHIILKRIQGLGVNAWFACTSHQSSPQPSLLSYMSDVKIQSYTVIQGKSLTFPVNTTLWLAISKAPFGVHAQSVTVALSTSQLYRR
jgi:hypothetical protein